MITIEGSLENRSYTDKNGNNRTAYEVKVERAHFGDSGSKQNNNASSATVGVGSFEPDFGAVSQDIDDDEFPF